MISTGWIIGISIYLVYSILILIGVMRTYKKLSFLRKLEVNHSSEFPGFTRNDYAKWSKCELFFGGFFLLPLRLISAIVLVTITYISQVILSILFCNFTFKNGINRCHKFLANLITSLACRGILFFAGFYWITYQKQKPRNYNTSYFENLGEVPHATYISNHISWTDIVFYLAHPKSFGFVSNHKVKDFCFIGPIATIIQCIFVDRSSKQSKQQCFVDLKERIENIKENPTGKTQQKLFFKLIVSLQSLDDLR